MSNSPYALSGICGVYWHLISIIPLRFEYSRAIQHTWNMPLFPIVETIMCPWEKVECILMSFYANIISGRCINITIFMQVSVMVIKTEVYININFSLANIHGNSY